MKYLDYVLGFQGMFYLITALWPLIHISSFEAVVGFKPDKFQLFTTDLLILIIAIPLLASIKQHKTRAIVLLGLGSSLAFMVVELWFRKSIRPVFFLDFIIEAVIFLALLYAVYKNKDFV